MNTAVRISLRIGVNHLSKTLPSVPRITLNQQNYNTCLQSMTISRCIHLSPYLSKTSKTITLLNLDGDLAGEMTFHEAKDLASKEHMSLVLISRASATAKTDVYKLEEDSSKKKIKKHKLTVTSKISDHDMQVKLKHVAQWVEKGCEVKITIKIMDNEKGANRLFKQVCKAVEPFGQIPKAQTLPHEIIAYINQATKKSQPKDHKLFTNEELKERIEKPK